MKENTDSDLNRKIFMTKSFLDSAQLLERTTNQIIAGSQEEAESKADDTKFRRKMTAHFLYAVIFELCIKIIWEIEHGTSPKPNHDILSRYDELSDESTEMISNFYSTQVTNIKHLISLSNGQVDSKSKVVNLNINLQSLEDALESNQETIKNFKYDGRFNGKSSVLCSVMWTDDKIFLLPKPEIIVFPESLLKYAISLNRA